MRPSLRSLLVALTRIVIWLLGISVAATLLFPGLTPTKLLAGLGLGSIVIRPRLSLKDVFENFLAGILILVRKPMRIGDDIDCEIISGRVEKITIRDTYLRKRSGELVLVPNSYLFKNPVDILTDRRERRIVITVGIAYGEDADVAREVIAPSDARARDRQRRPQRRRLRPGLRRELDRLPGALVGRLHPAEEHRSRDEITRAIKRALDEAGIEIPFPYPTLTFKEPLPLARAAPDAS
jgi:small conductance mechanosensitive channel